MQGLNFIFIILEVLVLFNLLIIVHELGHFLAARWRGLHVERFGIWFGKPLWERTFGGVKYSWGSIPAGGFVALPQMAPMEALEGESEVSYADLPKIGAIDKIIVAFAGPLFSFGLALFFACVVWIIGQPVSETDTTTVVGYVVPGSPAEQAGILPGDRVLEIDGGPVDRWSGIGDAVTWRVVSSVGETIAIKVDRNGESKELVATPTRAETKFWERASLRQIEMIPVQTPIVAEVQANSPAERAGIEVNDVIEAVNSIKLYNPRGLSRYIQENPDEELVLDIRRNDQPVQVTLRPVMPVYPEEYKEEKRVMIGVLWDLSGNITITHPGPWEQINDSVMKMANTFKALFAAKSDIGAQHLSGPVGIMRIYYLLFESEFGWRLALWFSVLLNVNLALLNLLPIPVLDGGHIVMATIEGLFRRPIPFWILNYVQAGCALLVIGYILYLTFYDVQDLPWKREKVPEIYFAAPSAKTVPAVEPATAR
ncbi:MAG: Regulator of sigma-E protease RseP [Verrucomicrobia subdivision 3 bacterium]|nr:Regulator of sigma-E protease RseP [Limisphaerales bacterium]